LTIANKIYIVKLIITVLTVKIGWNDMLSARDFLTSMKSEMMSHPVMTHRFWSQFESGQATPKGIRQFTLQYYHHVLFTRLYDAMVLARTPSEALQAALATILWDEYGRGDPGKTHPEQFRKVLRGLNLSETDWKSISFLPELETYIDVHRRLCQDYSIWVGLGVVGLAMEYPIPYLYQKLIPGFRYHGLSDNSLEFFLEHMPTDEVHSNLLEAALLPELDEKNHQVLVREGVRRSLDARTYLMDGLERVTFG
jgi:pyrroloquinoline-quinone synthase